MGLVCIFVWFTIVSFGEMAVRPVAYPAGILLGLLCLVAFFALLIYYFKVRKAKRSRLGVALDVVTSLVYLPAFILFYSCLYNVIC